MNNVEPDATPHLKKRAEFESILQNYQLSDRAKQVLKELKLVLLNGPSATGRNTAIDQLTKSGQYHYVISDTTRPPRINNGIREQDGREYWFRSEDDILRDLQNGEFLEAEIIHSQQVSGISIRELEQATVEGKIAINEVEIGGLQNVLQLKPDTVAIIMLPPSFDEWLRRFRGRGEMKDAEVKNRLQTAERIFETIQQGSGYTALVINDTLEHAAAKIDALAHGQLPDPTEQQQARQLATELLQKTRHMLTTL